MRARYVARSGDHKRLVEVREVGSLFEISIDGEIHRVDASRIGNTTVTSLIVDGRSYEVGTVEDGDRIDVSVHGEIHPVHVYDEIWARASEGHAVQAARDEEIQAPIPGTLVKILVALGDHVPAGTPVAVLEAMKMQNELAARHGGVVTRIDVSPGDTVAAGQTLLVLVPPAPSQAASP